MCNIKLKGGRPLFGSVSVQGAKNSVLPILAATVLTDGECVIMNCPDLSDVKYSIKILEHLGCRVKREGDTVLINSGGVTCGHIPDILMHQMRSSITFLGAVTARCKKARMSSPGGCELGPRPIDLHIKALKELGVKISESGGVIDADGSGMKGADIHLDFPSVGATENIMLSAVLTEGITKINNAAKEPEILDLQEFLNKMGAKVYGAGSDIIVIEGVKKLKGATHRVISDRIVASTYLCACMMCGGEIALKNVERGHFAAVEASLRDMGGRFSSSGDELILKAPEKSKAIDMIRTMPYPGFPTDAQAPVTAALSIAEGTSVIMENIFENRFKHCMELNKMGADIKTNGSLAIIKGVDNLRGANVSAMELRGGAALVIAGAAAEGITNVSDIEYIERGYEDIVFDMKSLGADIEKIF